MDTATLHELLGGIPIELTVDGIGLRESGSFGDWVDAAAPEGAAYSVRRRVGTLGGLEVTLEVRDYGGQGAELCSALRNPGPGKSGAVGDIRHLSIKVPPTPEKRANAYHCRRILYAMGSHAIAEDFMPREVPLCLGRVVVDMTETRSSSGYMPYFNYMQDEDNGLFAAVGWTGHWRAVFETNGELNFDYPNAAFRLESGEELPLPSALLVPWSCPSCGSHSPEAFNVFRRFMLDHIAPKIGGKPFSGAVCLRAWGNIDETGHNIRWNNMKKYGLPCDAYGVDAGWYDAEVAGNRNWYNTVGDWEADPKVFPEANDEHRGGLCWLADGGRDAGAKGFWLWIEFERAVKASKSFAEHPEYYMKSPSGDSINQIKLYDPEARKYLRDKLVRIFRESGMTIFRVDYNFDPGTIFAAYDTPETAGLTELRYYNALYTFFEELKSELPDLAVDNCASGGRRLDYRMYRYAVPVMCRSDFFTNIEFDPTGAQAQTMALARWLPVQSDSCGSCMGTTPITFDTYRVRSSMACGIGIAAPSWPLSEAEGKWYRTILDEAMAVKPYMSLDFYPLTGWSLSRFDWAAWETVSRDGDRGMVMAFRRENCASPEQTYVLSGLQHNAWYVFTDAAGNFLGRYNGASLAAGYTITIPERRGSKIVFFKKE